MLWDDLVSYVKGWLACLHEGALCMHTVSDEYEEIQDDWLTYTALCMLQYGGANLLINCNEQ